MRDVLRVALAIARARRAAFRETLTGSGPLGDRRHWLEWVVGGVVVLGALGLLVFLTVLPYAAGTPGGSFAATVNTFWFIVAGVSLFLAALRPGPITWRLARAPVSPAALRLGLALAPLAGGLGLFTLAGFLAGTAYLAPVLRPANVPGVVLAVVLSFAVTGSWAALLALVGSALARASAGRFLCALVAGGGAFVIAALAVVAAGWGDETPAVLPGHLARAVAVPGSPLDVPRGIGGLVAWGLLGLALAEPLFRRATRLPRRRASRAPRLPRIPVLTGGAGTAAAARLAFLARHPATWGSLLFAALAGAFVGDPVLGRPGWGTAAYLPCLVPALLATHAADRFQVDRRGAVRWILAPVRPLAVLLGQDLVVLLHVALLAGLGHLAARAGGLSPAPGDVGTALPGPLLVAAGTFTLAAVGSSVSLLRPWAPMPAFERSNRSRSPVELLSWALLGWGLGPLSLVPGWLGSRGHGGAALAAATALFLVAGVSWWAGTRAVARRYRTVGSRFLAAFSVPWA